MSSEGLEGFDQTRASPIEDMIVGKHATIDSSGEKAADVLRAHPIIDAFANELFASRDTGFEVDDANVGPRPAPFLQRGTPNIGIVHRSLDWPVLELGETNIVVRRGHITLIKDWIARVPQDLIDAAPGHYVSAEKNPDRSHRVALFQRRTAIASLPGLRLSVVMHEAARNRSGAISKIAP